MRTLVLAAAAVLCSCASTPPRAWSAGGAPILVPQAEWRDEDGTTVQVRPDGAVLVNGVLLLSLDPAGRVYDSSGEGVAVLLADGRLSGPDDTMLGRIGVGNAAPPGSDTAWISVQPNGDVLYADDDGERHAYGHWTGCNGPARRTCTLVTHLVTLQRLQAATASTVWVGMGVGVYR
jgi:hypothetical protein